MPATATPPQPIVSAIDHVVVASSHDVAAYFEREHFHVLRDIDVLIGDLASLGESLQPIENLILSKSGGYGEEAANPCNSHTAQNWTVWFREVSTEQKVGFGTRLNRAFTMTRDGFTLLAMGFTGPKALRFKVAYIEAFNAMERELAEREAERSRIALMFHADQILTLDDRVLDMEDRITDQGDRIAELEDKLARLAGHAVPAVAPHSNTIADTARFIGIKPLALLAELRRRGWIVEDTATGATAPSPLALAQGFMIQHEEATRLWDGSIRTTTQPRLLERGSMLLVREIEV